MTDTRQDDPLQSRRDELRRAVDFYETCQANREQAKETGAMRDALDWLIEVAVALAKDPLFR